MSAPYQNPAMEMLGHLMLAGKTPVTHIIRPHADGTGLLRAEYRITSEGMMQMPTVTGMVVVEHFDHARYEQVFRADLEYRNAPRYSRPAYVPEVER